MFKCRRDFPLLNKLNEDTETWAYLDSAATTQKPQIVLDAILDFYMNKNANPYRGAYSLGENATALVESVRENLREFLNAQLVEEIIFTKNTTDAINTLARGMAESFTPNDEIVLAISEHHSNFLPWQKIAKERGVKLVFLGINEVYGIDDSEIKKKIGPKTKLVTIAQVSNVSGEIYPIKSIVQRAREVGARVVVDAAQSVGHFAVDVRDLGVDFLAFSGHKMFGPMGVGVLYGRMEELEKLTPSTLGGGMIERVDDKCASFAVLPNRLEAGTPDAASIAGLGAALGYIKKIGLDKIWEHEQKLTQKLLKSLDAIEGLDIIGSRGTTGASMGRTGVLSFRLAGVHSHDLATVLGVKRVAVRAGHQCAQPFMEYLGLEGTCRASLHAYNNENDILRLVEGIKEAKRRFG